MNWRERNQMDEHIAGGHYQKETVELVCNEPQGVKDDPDEDTLGCGWSGTGMAWSEYGTGGFEPEECPDCNGEIAESIDV